MRANKRARRRAKFIKVRRTPTHVQRVPSRERIQRESRIDEVMVRLAHGVESGVERRVGTANLRHANVLREDAVEGSVRAGEVREGLAGVEVHHLTAGVDAGVGAPGCCEADELAILADEFRKRPLHLTLNRLALGLVLKSEVGLAVVRDGEGVRAVAAARLAVDAAFVAQRRFERVVAPVALGVNVRRGGGGGRVARDDGTSPSDARSRCRVVRARAAGSHGGARHLH